MSEERPTRRSFFNRMFVNEEEGEETMIFTPEDAGLEQGPEEPMDKPQGGLTVERAASVIRKIPDDVPHSSAVPIVRLTLEAAGISMGELGTSTRARESKLNSVIEQRENRINKLQEDTEKAVRYKEQEIRSLEEDIKKFRQARDNGISQEEQKISTARSGLDEVELVRGFFDLSAEEEPEEPEPDDNGTEESGVEAPSGDDTRVMNRPDFEDAEDKDTDDTEGTESENMDDTQVLRRPGPLSENWDTRGNRGS